MKDNDRHEFQSLHDWIIRESLGDVAYIDLVVTRDGHRIAFCYLGYGHFISRNDLEYTKELIEDTLQYYEDAGLTDDKIKEINHALADNHFSWERNWLEGMKKKGKKDKRGKKTVIYVVRDSSSSSIKVGKSTNPKSRLKGHQTSNPNLLELIFEHNGFDIDEKNIHQELINAGFHIHGEWFKDCQDSLDIVKRYFDREEQPCPASSE